ncbi:anti-sigma factor antagonist [Prosthecochloris sp. ZM_2]|uniref:STAS domain-containing protein n=1 Tax=Prosthecochloris sp. ZM_2 TaxID=2045206 RepID=UPI000DF7F743|nr:STAS domain-containing protein [Prosthecochloris sp. ZM_2]RNA64771.1 anti-sigma factor antagonist [Prosthecochloris sp. ZM_2]
MRHSVSSRRDLTILKIEEPVFDVRYAPDFSETIDTMLNKEGHKHLIIDFSMVKAIDSCGISCLLEAHKQANQSEGLAIFVALCQQIKELLKIACLDKQLYIFTSLNEVMTLIDPTAKTRRASRKKSRPRPMPEETPDDLEAIAATDYADENIIDEAEKDENDPAAGTGNESVSAPRRKRGRPRKPESEKKSHSPRPKKN